MRLALPFWVLSFLVSYSHQRVQLGSLPRVEQNSWMASRDILGEYFNYKRAKSLILVACAHDDNGYEQLSSLANYCIACGFRVQIVTEDTNKALLVLQSLWYKTGLVLNFHSPLSCTYNLSLAILKRAAMNNHFTTDHVWLMALGNDVPPNTILGDIFIPTDGDVKLLISSPTSVLIDIYRVATQAPLQMQILAENFTDGRSLVGELRKSKAVKRKDLQGISLRGGIVIAYPDVFTTIDDLKFRHIDTIAKFNFPITENLRHDLNFKLNSRQFDNYGWQNNGTFDGMMGLFQRAELDYGQNALFMRLDRIPVIDFLAETYKIRACIMFRQPPLSAVANIFAMTFSSEVWSAILIFMIGTCLALAILRLWTSEVLAMGILDCVMFSLGAICQQSFFLNMAVISGQILVFTTFISTLFLFTSFSANIVALLQSPSEAIRSLTALTQSPLEVGLHDTMYNKIYFNESTDQIVRALFLKKLAHKGENAYMRPNYGMEKVRTGLFAFQIEAQTGYQIISDIFDEPEKCGLKELEPFQLPMMAIPVSKRFPNKELFRQRLRWQREVGVMQREALRWFPQKPKCENKMAGFASIGLSESRYPFKLFACGVCIAICLLCIEILWDKISSSYNHSVLHYKRRQRVSHTLH